MNFFLWLILIFFLLSLGLRLFLRYGMPWLLSRFMKKQQEKFNQAYQQQQGSYREKKEGEVEINVQPKKETKKDDEFGEYIDFEEEV
jgi:hypothetical protein